MPGFGLVGVVQVFTVEDQTVPALEGSVEPEVEGALFVPLGHQFVAGLKEHPCVPVQLWAVGQDDAEGVLDRVVADSAVALEAKVSAVHLVAPADVHIHPEVMNTLTPPCQKSSIFLTPEQLPIFFCFMQVDSYNFLRDPETEATKETLDY